MNLILHWLLHRHWTREPDHAWYFASMPGSLEWYPISREDYQLMLRHGDDIALLKLDEVTR